MWVYEAPGNAGRSQGEEDKGWGLGASPHPAAPFLKGAPRYPQTLNSHLASRSLGRHVFFIVSRQNVF